MTQFSENNPLIIKKIVLALRIIVLLILFGYCIYGFNKLKNKHLAIFKLA